ncbi:MAG: class I SAM-dependent methyltransferase [Methanosarcinales archaeon]|nr:class I SAM-dependent methyltransferase [Methanosarcinales archaeon]
MKEAKYYDRIHIELYNRYEQNRITSSLNKVIQNFNINCKILEIGSGTGNLTIKLLENGFKNIICVDISKEMIDELKKKIRNNNNNNNNIKFIISDVDSFLENDKSKYDIVFMSSVLHHLPNYGTTLKNIKKILNDNGCIYITHEPLPPPKKSMLIKILSKLDFYTYAVRYLFFISIGKLRFINRNCEYSDYHTGDRAIDILQLKEIFRNDYNIEIKKYPIAKFGFTVYALNKLKYFNSFEFVSCRK